MDGSGWTEDELHKAVQAEAARPFDLAAGSLMRVVLFQRQRLDIPDLASKGSTLLIVFHRIAVDFWSILLLLDDLRILMMPQPATRKAESDSQLTVRLPALYNTSIDYSLWMTEIFTQTPQAASLAAFWLKNLGGELPVRGKPSHSLQPPMGLNEWSGFGLTS